MYFIRSLILITTVSLLSGCIMGSPYGGVIFVGPIDLIRINQERSKEVNDYYQNRKTIIMKTEITLTQENLLLSKENIGVIEFILPDDKEYTTSLNLDYRDNTMYKIISKVPVTISNEKNRLPLIDYGKIDKRYSDYQLYSASFRISSRGKGYFYIEIFFNKENYFPSCTFHSKIKNDLEIPILKMKFKVGNSKYQDKEIICTQSEL
ncbi:hypothetical protein [Proteus terrae]|uniref:hypothetical protein n=1 Tax=Proteus terrae TaxID=1574161 RepID=UPI00131FB9A3|nr:hypothetical protein [Proteus terrae]QHD93402.1 hypothetical protein GSM99_01445 [Proteus terrae subsp. cibarius]QJW51954.1 hypothetical protein HND96_14180 [Proteus terrae subsp. cibarius]